MNVRGWFCYSQWHIVIQQFCGSVYKHIDNTSVNQILNNKENCNNIHNYLNKPLMFAQVWCRGYQRHTLTTINQGLIFASIIFMNLYFMYEIIVNQDCLSIGYTWKYGFSLAQMVQCG